LPGWPNFEPRAKIGGADDRPNVSRDACTPKHFGGVDSRNAKANVADMPVCGEILIS
jgi:hypothetical protein